MTKSNIAHPTHSIIAALMFFSLVLSSCSNATGQSATSQFVDESSTELAANSDFQNDISISLIVTNTSVDNGWKTVIGVLGFINQGIEPTVLSFDEAVLQNNNYSGEISNVYINTNEGVQYPVEMKVRSVEGSYPLYSFYLPTNVPMILLPTGRISGHWFQVTYKIPETLTLTNLVIDDIFSDPTGNSQFLIDQFYANETDWESKYSVVTTNSLPINLTFTDGTIMEIQNGWNQVDFYGETHRCLAVHVNNTNLTQNGQVDSTRVRFYFERVYDTSLVSNFSTSVLIGEASLTSGSDSPVTPGPGQQKELWLCLNPTAGMNMTEGDSILLSIYGLGVNEVVPIGIGDVFDGVGTDLD